MNIIKIFRSFFINKDSQKSPILIIKKENIEDNLKEFSSIEKVISELENDPNVSAEKIEKLKASIKNLRDKDSIKIKNGGII